MQTGLMRVVSGPCLDVSARRIRRDSIHFPILLISTGPSNPDGLSGASGR
jgi:hypothetical protein